MVSASVSDVDHCTSFDDVTFERTRGWSIGFCLEGEYGWYAHWSEGSGADPLQVCCDMNYILQYTRVYYSTTSVDKRLAFYGPEVRYV